MRAWTCHGRNQRDMVDRLRQAGIVRSQAVQRVLTQVDRRHYVPANRQEEAHQDTPLSIGLGQTISAPHMHAHVLEEMYPYVMAAAGTKDIPATGGETAEQPEEEVAFLDVGCGSGYLTACMGRWLHAKDGENGTSILGRKGKVYGIDIYSDLVEMTRTNMMKADADLLTSGTVTLQAANGWQGLPDAAPFDAIHVGAAAAAFPQQLALQLKVGGVLIVPIGPQQGAQALYKIERLKDSSGKGTFEASDYKLTELLGVRYVPLVDREPS